MRSLACCLSVTALVAGSAANAAQVGSVLEQQKISVLEGGFTGTLEEDDYFGYSLAALGDLNGDGTSDLAASTREGAVWILFLGPDGRVLAQVEAHVIPDSYGLALARLGDLDGDGVTELAVGSAVTQTIEILFLRTDGTVRASHRILHTDPVFVPPIEAPDSGLDPSAGDAFGYALAGLGDVNGDGTGDLAVGAPYDNDGPGRYNGALWIVRLERDGRARSAQKISERRGGGDGVLDTLNLGSSLASLGDLDGDGNPELLVSHPSSPAIPIELQTPSLWVLSLDENERLRSARRIGQEEFGLVRDLDGLNFECGFALSLAVLGDIDEDGTIEFGAGASGWTPTPEGLPTFAPRVGAFLVGSLRRDGTLARRLLVTTDSGGFSGSLPLGTSFGGALAALGDIDRDGRPELAVGASADDDGGEDTGSIWILELDASAVRNGSGRNPLTLQQAAEPRIGTSWKVTLDCSGRGPGLAFLAGYGAPLAGLPTPAGELLIDVFASPRIFRLVTAHPGSPVLFVTQIPRDVSLIGRAMFVQGLCSSPSGLQLSNALDVIVGR